MANKVFGIIPDVHAPYHDKKDLKLAITVIQAAFRGLPPEKCELLLLGDFADFHAIHLHGPKHPGLVQLLKDEVEGVNQILDEIDYHFGGIHKTYLEGNHESRLERFILKNCKELFGVTQWDFLLKLNQRLNWTTIAYNNAQKYKLGDSNLYARHSPFSYSSAKASATKAFVNLIHGCTHRSDEFNVVALDGMEYTHQSFGWLGDERLDKIYGYMKNKPQWTKGFGLVYIVEGQFFIQKIRIKDHMCIFNGQVYR